MKGLLFAIIAGSLGVAIWVGAGYLGMEHGIVAWGIGGLVGFGTAMADEQRGLEGITAALVAAGAVVLGKFIVFQMYYAVPGVGFGEMFGGYDILWFFLACGTAFRIGSNED